MLEMGKVMTHVIKGMQKEFVERLVCHALCYVMSCHKMFQWCFSGENVWFLCITWWWMTWWLHVISSRAERSYDVEVILQGLAELKHVKDVLIGRLSQSEVMVSRWTCSLDGACMSCFMFHVMPCFIDVMKTRGLGTYSLVATRSSY